MKLLVILFSIRYLLQTPKKKKSKSQPFTANFNEKKEREKKKERAIYLFPDVLTVEHNNKIKIKG